MPRRTDDRSPGDARAPYSDLGGPEARHAQTHDVRREELTNPTGPTPRDDEFAADLATDDGHQGGGHADESTVVIGDKRLAGRLAELSADELARLTVLDEGAQLDQGGVYLDLNHRERGPFKALGGHRAGRHERYVAKRDTDHERGNRRAGDRGHVIEQPVKKPPEIASATGPRPNGSGDMTRHTAVPFTRWTSSKPHEARLRTW